MSEMDGWQIKRLDQIGDVYSGATPSTAKAEYWDGDIVWVTPNDLSKLQTPFLSESAKKITKRGLKNCSTHLLPARSVTISSRAPIGYVAVPVVDFCTNQGCKSIKLYPEYQSEFVYYNILFNVEMLRNLGEGTTFAEISKTTLSAVEMPFLDNFEEQTQIATILSTLDRAIEQTEVIIAKQQRIKAGLMQNLLTKGIDEHGVIRSEATHQFKDSPLGRIPVEWEVLPAHTLCEAVIDCKNRTPPESKEGHPVIRTPNVRAGKFVESGLTMTDPKSYEIWTARGKPRPGDVVITREAPFGEACLIPDNITAPCLGQRMMMYQTDPQKLRSDFMVFAIYSERVQRRLLELAGGSTVGHIRVGDIRNLSIPHPKDIDEQENIAITLTGIEKVITSLTNNVKNLRLTKAGLMHDLLTGTVRIN